MNHSAPSKLPALLSNTRVLLAVCAVVGIVVGVLVAVQLVPQQSRYKVSANVALLPAPNLSMADASGYWEVLTRGQVNRTAAIIYEDRSRWVPLAAAAAKVPESDLTLTAAAVPETTMVTVSMEAGSPEAAEIALNDVLTVASEEVERLSAPFLVRVMWPQKGSAAPLPAPSRVQLLSAGALGGLLVGCGIALLLARLVRRPSRSGGEATTKSETAAQPAT